MKSVFPWYVYAVLGLMLTGIGLSGVALGRLLPNGFYMLGGLLLFGLAVIGRSRGIKGRTDRPLPPAELTRELTVLIMEEKTAEAVRHYRLYAGCDLMEAKGFIDGLAEQIKKQQEE